MDISNHKHWQRRCHPAGNRPLPDGARDWALLQATCKTAFSATERLEVQVIEKTWISRMRSMTSLQDRQESPGVSPVKIGL